MNVLLSVKPKYAEEILSGRKKYEFRRSIFKKQNIEKVYIYSSSPVSKIVAAFEIGKILKGSPENIWNLCHKYAGISKNDFFDYFKNADVAYAIEISNIDSFLNPIDPCRIIEDFKPPQSFYYVLLSFLLNRWEGQNAQLQKCTHLNEHFSGISRIDNCKFEN
jgi:type I restriction enzyme S subunit